jgi:RNA polymerase sigma factor (sigma-70 family)
MDATLAAEAAALPAAERADWLCGCEDAYPAVYRALIAMGTQQADAGDALQDAFVDALRERRVVAHPAGWLFVAAQRHLRRARWRHRIFAPLDAVRGSIRSDRDQEIDLLVELGRLTERQRTVIVARYVLGLSQRETAVLLGVARGTVAATTYQATTLLRERLLGGTQ